MKGFFAAGFLVPGDISYILPSSGYIVNKMDKKNPVWILNTTESLSLLIPLLLMGIDQIKVNSGFVGIGLLLGVEEF